MSEQVICPNCGANMHIKNFVFICDFCGTRLTDNNYTSIPPTKVHSAEIYIRFNYIKRNEQDINKSPFIQLYVHNDSYRIISIPPFFSNDGKYNLIRNFFIYLMYTNNIDYESLFLVIYTKQEITESPELSILVDNKLLITSVFDSCTSIGYIFKIEIAEFKIICLAKSILLSSNIIDLEFGNYDEFIPFCRRFYNMAFDKQKYIYSLNQNLISDGK